MSDSTARAESNRPFGFRDKFSYLLGDFGCNMSFSLIGSFMMLFYTQFVGISLFHFGFIILFTKIWDGINDPLIGALIDRAHPKSGNKFRPWIFWGSFPLTIGGALVFLDSSHFPYWAKIGFCIVTYLIFDISYTVVNVPYGSLNSVITSDPVERAQLSTWRGFGSMFAMVPIQIVVPMIAYKTITVDGKSQSLLQGQNLFWLALGMGIISFICFQILYHYTSERIKHKKHSGEKFNYFKTFKDFFSNRTLLAVAMGAFIQLVFIFSITTTNTLVFQIYFGNGKLSGLSILPMLAPLIIVAPFVKQLVAKFGKKNLCSWPFLISAAILFYLMITPIRNPYVFIGFQTLAFIFTGIYNAVSWALVSDGTDSLELKTGRREEGSVYATYSLVRKLAQGVGGAMIPFIIASLVPGFIMSDPKSWLPQHALQIKNIATALPFIGTILEFIIFNWIYDLDKEKTKELEEKLGRHSADVDTSIASMANQIDQDE